MSDWEWRNEPIINPVLIMSTKEPPMKWEDADRRTVMRMAETILAKHHRKIDTIKYYFIDGKCAFQASIKG
mgnify:CR=1 FL=1